MKRVNFKGLIAGAALALCALTPYAGEASTADRFKSVKAWSVTFEIRFDLDENGNPYKTFQGTRSVAGSLRWGEPSEDYGITWSGVGKATVTTTEGSEEIAIEESYLSIVPEDNMYSAKFGDAGGRQGHHRHVFQHAHADGGGTVHPGNAAARGRHGLVP